MLKRIQRTQGRQRRASVAVVAILFCSALSHEFAASAADEPGGAVAQRSEQQLGPTQEFDRRAAQAFQSKSLDDVRRLDADLNSKFVEIEHHAASGGSACGCDVAIAALRIIVGYALNKLDGQGRYQTWMQDESIQLVKKFHDYLTDCAIDAGRSTINLQLEPDHVKAL